MKKVLGHDKTPSASPSAVPVSASPTPAEPRELRYLTPEEARAVLPTEADLPGTGWDSPPSTEDSTSPTTPEECIQIGRGGPVVQRAEPDVKESITYFTKDPRYVNAKFVISSWQTADDGVNIDEVGALADRCRTFSATNGVKTAPVSVTRLTAPAIGEKQVAVRLEVGGEGYLTIFYARIGHTMITLSVVHSTTDDELTPFKSTLDSIMTDLAAG